MSRHAGLGAEDVVDCALKLVERGGADALTMRKLASELGVTANTIYWHVGGRDAVIIEVIKRVAERQGKIEIIGTDSRTRVMSITHHLWRSALAHRRVTALANQVGATPLLEFPLERALAAELSAAGLPGPEVRDAVRSIFMCVAGFLVVAFRRDNATEASKETIGVRVQDLWRDVEVTDGDDPSDPDRYVDPEAIVALQQRPDLEALFDRTLRTVVSGFVPEGAQPNFVGATRD